MLKSLFFFIFIFYLIIQKEAVAEEIIIMTFVPYLTFYVVQVGKEIIIAHYTTQASKLLIGEEKNRSITNAIQITNSNYFLP